MFALYRESFRNYAPNFDSLSEFNEQIFVNFCYLLYGGVPSPILCPATASGLAAPYYVQLRRLQPHIMSRYGVCSPILCPATASRVLYYGQLRRPQSHIMSSYGVPSPILCPATTSAAPYYGQLRCPQSHIMASYGVHRPILFPATASYLKFPLA